MKKKIIISIILIVLYVVPLVLFVNIFANKNKPLERIVKIYESGELKQELTGFFKIETNRYTGVVTIKENRDSKLIHVHKFLPSKNTLIIIMEVTID